MYGGCSVGIHGGYGVLILLCYYFGEQEQQLLKLKNEKLKIAMMKLKEASVQKVSFLHSHDILQCAYKRCP